MSIPLASNRTGKLETSQNRVSIDECIKLLKESTILWNVVKHKLGRAFRECRFEKGA